MAFFKSRQAILLAVGCALAAVLVWRWLGSGGSVTVNFVDTPLAKVAASLEKQTGIPVITNADLTMPVTLQLVRAPAFDAFETLAARIDGDFRFAGVAGPGRGTFAEAKASFSSTSSPEGWAVSSAGWGGSWGLGETMPDLRKIHFQPSPQEETSLRSWLAQISAKTGVTFVYPESWNPQVAKPPGDGKLDAVVPRFIKQAGGQSKFFAWISVRPLRTAENPSGGSEAGGSRSAGGPGGGGGGRFRGSGGDNPEWLAERVQAQIALLPPEEQAAARQQFEEMRAFWAAVRELPEDQRRAKIQEFFANPDNQERMEDRMMQRDTRRSPEQRAERYRRYVQRKQQALNQ